MKMLTKAIISKLPKLYSQEKNEDPMVVLKFFSPVGAATWYITEGEETEDGWMFFGLCDLYGDGGELGYVSLNELESVRLPFGLKIERDLHWEPVPLSKVRKS